MSHHGGKTQLFVNNASNCKTAFSFHISFLYDFFFSVQFHDSPVRFTVLTSRFATELFSDDSAAPGSEHHGLSSVALGAQQRHDYQPCPRHQEQPLYSSSAGTFKDKHAHKGCSSTTSLLLLIWSFFSLLFLFFIVVLLAFQPALSSWACHTPTWWWATSTSSRMKTRPKLKDLWSMCVKSVLYMQKIVCWYCVWGHCPVACLCCVWFYSNIQWKL